MAEIIEDVFDRPVIDGDFARGIYARENPPGGNVGLSRPLLHDTNAVK